MAQHYNIPDTELYNKIKKEIIFEYKFMVVFRSKHNQEIIVWNITKPFSSSNKEKGHGHLKSIKMAKTICHNIVDSRMPKQREHYILICHIRCSNDEKYIEKIEELLETRRQKGKTLGYKNTIKSIL